jgi:sugar lactone lactonase YvrE
MNAIQVFVRPIAGRVRAALLHIASACICLALAACGGSADAPPPPESGPVQPVAPTITQQPASLSVTVGQPASFTVAATGTAPLAYQWQRNGVAIAGATSTTYSLATTVLGDSGATFRAIVSNVAGSATSNDATLTVTVSAPVLTIAPQPASTSVVAGTPASFTVGGTCSTGTLNIQWQRGQGATFAAIAGATAATYSFTAVIGDSGALFRAVLDCSGQSSTASSAATLTVTAPGSITLSLLPIVGLRDQASISSASAIDQDPGNSFSFITSSRIKRLSADLSTITPVAGGQFSGAADGAATVASFNQPQGLTQDAAGNLYVADTGNHTIRRVAADGTVSTIAGLAGTQGTSDGTGSAARFNQPTGIALGPDGDLYVADRSNNLIRRVTTAGVVTTYAGSSAGFADGAAAAAMFNGPLAVAVAANGDVLVADSSNHRIRRILRAGTTAGAVQTLAGNGTFSAADPDGTGTAAVISFPHAVVLRGNTLTVRDQFVLRQIDLTTAVVTTLTGSRSLGEGYADGSKTTARIRDSGIGITGAPNGGFMLADDLALRSVSAAGDVRTIAANAAAGVTQAGVGVLAQMPFALAVNDPQGITVDPAGNVVVSDNGTRVVRRISPAGVVTLAAGLVGSFGGAVDGVGSEAQFANLRSAIFSDSTGVTYVSDGFGAVRRIATDNATTSLAGAADAFGAVDGNGPTARFNGIGGFAVGTGGNVFVGDAANNALRRIDPAGNVTTYAGVFGQSVRVDGPIATARFIAPGSLAFAPDGSLYVVDSGAIRRISADGSTVSTIAAAGGQVTRLAVDAAGTVFYGAPSGLYMLQGATTTLLIPVTGSNVLGSNPSLFVVSDLAVLGPKRIVLLSGGQILVATLP